MAVRDDAAGRARRSRRWPRRWQSALGTEPVEEIAAVAARDQRRVVAGRRGGPASAAGESLLIIADQFEELFRFDVTRDQQANAALFVNQLLEATEQRDAPIYVVVTMRSEFLGRCSEFTGLAEAFNRSQYLVPRLTRDERREAIERPLKLFGTDAVARAGAAGAQRHRRRSRPAAGAAARAAANLSASGSEPAPRDASNVEHYEARRRNRTRARSPTATRSWPA